MPDMLVTGAPLKAFWTNTGVG
ncbi:MAG: hypothetical protein JWP75_203, partial [Frondihabitans sp.]|nr:hypothetical protein [Frondihabitans sp.]